MSAIFGKLGDRVEIVRRLLFAEAAVEVGSQAAMFRVAGKLANVVGVIDDVLERHGLGRRHAS